MKILVKHLVLVTLKEERWEVHNKRDYNPQELRDMLKRNGYEDCKVIDYEFIGTDGILVKTK